MRWADDPRPLADCLRAWAAEHGIERGSARWISQQIGAPQRTVEEWLQGRRKPPLEGVIRRCMDLLA